MVFLRSFPIIPSVNRAVQTMLMLLLMMLRLMVLLLLAIVVVVVLLVVVVVVVAAASSLSKVGASSAASRADSSHRSLGCHLVRANTAINNESPALKVVQSPTL